MEEKTPLLRKEQNGFADDSSIKSHKSLTDKQSITVDGELLERTKTSVFQIITFGLVLSFNFFAYGIFMYVINEYTQETVRNSFIGVNESVENFSPCELESKEAEELNHKIQAKSSEWLVYYAIAGGIPSIVSNLILGSYTDAFGRKFLFCINFLGTFTKFAISAIVIKFEGEFYFFLIGCFIEGCTGQLWTLFSVSFAYVSDLTVAGKSRTVGIVLVELAAGISVSIASFATGYFIEAYKFFWPMTTGAILSFTSFLVALIFLPETLQKKDRRKSKSMKENLLTAVRFYTKSEGEWKRCQYRLLLMCFILTAISSLNRNAMDTLYQLGKPFCWSPRKVGWFGTMRMGLNFVIGTSLIFIFRRCMTDEVVAMLGAFSAVGALVVEGFATTNTQLYMVPVVGVISSLPIPMIRSLMSKMTSAEKQGALFAGIGAVETVCFLLSSLTGNIIYTATMTIMNGFVFLVQAALIFISIFLFIALIVIERLEKRTTHGDRFLEISVTVDNVQSEEPSTNC